MSNEKAVKLFVDGKELKIPAAGIDFMPPLELALETAPPACPVGVVEDWCAKTGDELHVMDSQGGDPSRIFLSGHCFDVEGLKRLLSGDSHE